MLKVKLPVNEKQKQKLKKNALDFVNYDEEKKNDPKYKTELCKSFMDTSFCAYGNRCRFAHGKKELFDKNLDSNKYKQKLCNSFRENGFCLYGTRCNFKHGENKLENISRSYYHYRLKTYFDENYFVNFCNNHNDNHSTNNINSPFSFNLFKESFNKESTKRLDAFCSLSKTTENSSTSVSSNDSAQASKLVYFPNFNLSNKKIQINFNSNNGISSSINNLNSFKQINLSKNFGSEYLHNVGFYPANFYNKATI